MIKVSIKDKRFHENGAQVISNLEFAVNEGELVAIIGPSGAGKSTLLNLISGLDKAFEGEIVHRPGSAARISLMFQEPRLMNWLTVLENVTLVAGAGPAHRERALSLLDMVGLADAASLFPQQLSGGMQKRVALARAFMPQPDILLMDEPFSSLDVPAAEQLRNHLLRLWQELGTTILYVTHDLKEAISLADRILFLSKDPARLIWQQAVDLERPRSSQSMAIDLLQRELLQRCPGLLSGLAQER